jgi:hypothetical protein
MVDNSNMSDAFYNQLHPSPFRTEFCVEAMPPVGYWAFFRHISSALVYHSTVYSNCVLRADSRATLAQSKLELKLGHFLDTPPFRFKGLVNIGIEL